MFCLLLVASATCLFYPSVWVTGADLLLAIVAWLKNTHEQSKLIYFVVLAVTIAILMAFNALYVIKGANSNDKGKSIKSQITARLDVYWIALSIALIGATYDKNQILKEFERLEKSSNTINVMRSNAYATSNNLRDNCLRDTVTNDIDNFTHKSENIVVLNCAGVISMFEELTVALGDITINSGSTIGMGQFYDEFFAQNRYPKDNEKEELQIVVEGSASEASILARYQAFRKKKWNPFPQLLLVPTVYGCTGSIKTYVEDYINSVAEKEATLGVRGVDHLEIIASLTKDFNCTSLDYKITYSFPEEESLKAVFSTNYPPQTTKVINGVSPFSIDFDMAILTLHHYINTLHSHFDHMKELDRKLENVFRAEFVFSGFLFLTFLSIVAGLRLAKSIIDLAHSYF